MMYQHQIDECIKRAKEELRIYRQFRREDAAEHVKRRCDSLYRIREKAPKARIGAPL